MNNQASLNDLRKKYRNLKEIVSKDLQAWDPKTRPGMEGLQNRSRQELTALTPTIGRAILGNSTAVLILDDVPQAKDIMSAVVAEDAAMIAIDFLKLEKDLIKALYTNQTVNFVINSDIISRLNVELSEIGDEFEAVSMPLVDPQTTNFGALATKELLIEKLSFILTKTYGVDLKVLHVGNMINKAIEGLINENSITIVIANVPPSFTSALSGYTGQTVILAGKDGTAGAIVANEKTTPEAFLQTFEKMRQAKAAASGEVTEKTTNRKTNRKVSVDQSKGE